MRQWKWLGLPAASVAPLTKNRPISSAPYTFFILYVRFDRTRRRDDSRLTRLRWCHWCKPHVDQKVQHHVTIVEEQHLIL